MRYATILGVVLLAWATIICSDAAAKGPSGGSGSGGSGSGGSSNGSWNKSGSNSSWHQGQYHDYYHHWYPYVAQRPIYEIPVFSGLPIKIANPAANNVTLSYTLDGNVYTIPPGYSQTLQADRAWVIEFGRGADFGDARYGLEPGVYSFAFTNHGWELYHSAPVVQPDVAVAPSNPTPSNPTPSNPTPSSVAPSNATPSNVTPPSPPSKP